MCVFDRWFAYASRLPLTGDFPLPARIRDELLGAMLLLLLATSNIRRPVSATISATDATPQKGGRCRAQVLSSVARELYRQAEDRGEHVRLDWTLLEQQLGACKLSPQHRRRDEFLRDL